MMKITAMYFSATETTQKVVMAAANKISKIINQTDDINVVDFTVPEIRLKTSKFTSDDIIVIGVPVYAGRVPNILLKYLNSLIGNGAVAVAVVVYGNRDYDDALIELNDILAAGGFRVIAGGAFIGEHSFSKILAKGRPDSLDMEKVNDFSIQVAEKLINGKVNSLAWIRGNRPYRGYYMPKNKKNEPVDIRKVVPKVSDACVHCKLCITVCPMGSIDHEDVKKMKGICIKCGACIKKCPVQARYYDDENYLRHKEELEEECKDRREPEFFI